MKEEKNMLKYILQNKRGVISWLLSQIALLIATGILLASIASLTFYNDWKKEAELKAIADEIATFIETMDLKETENSTTLILPLKSYYYKVNISTEYISVMRKDGTIKKKIKVVEPLIIKPFVLNKSLNPEWQSKEELHEWLEEYTKQKYNKKYSGTSNNPLPSEKRSEIKKELDKRLNKISKIVARQPLEIDVNKPLYIEKAIIYFEDVNKNLETIGLVIVYQGGE